MTPPVGILGGTLVAYGSLAFDVVDRVGPKMTGPPPGCRRGGRGAHYPGPAPEQRRHRCAHSSGGTGPGAGRAFVAYASAHDDWDTDQGRVDQHNAMLTEVNDLMARWEAAERSCANTVDALYGGTQYGVNNGDGTASTNEYGLTADQWGSVATGKDGVPWGTAAGRDKPWYADVGDAVGGVFVGVGRGVTGLVTGLGGFVGFQGWDVMGRSWKGLGALAIVAVSPQVMVSGQGVLGYKPGEIQATVTGMGKGLIAYDRWASDPAQAAGESVFNIAPFFIPVGGAAAGAAKAVSLAGKAAGVVGVAGRAAKVADVLKASRVADVVAGVRTTLDLRLSNAANALHTALGGPDRALAGPGPRHLPEAPVPHTPDLHATTIHPDAPATPHPDGPSTPHSGTTPPSHPAPAAPPAHPYGSSTQPGSVGRSLSESTPTTPHLDAPAGPHGDAPAGPHPVPTDHLPNTTVDRTPIETAIDSAGLTSHQKGLLGEELTRNVLDNTPGVNVLGEQVRINVGGVDIRTDFLISGPDGGITIIESKYGPSAGFTPNQTTAYNALGPGSQPITFANPADSAAIADQLGRAVPADVTGVQVMRWEGAPGTLRMTAADVQRIVDDLSEVDGLKGSPARLLTKLEGLQPVGIP
jgi:hypothetical protein